MKLAALVLVLLAGCGTGAAEPRQTPLPPLPMIVEGTTSTTAVTVTVAPSTAPPTIGPLTDVYGNPIDDGVVFTVPAPVTAPPTAAPRPPRPQEPTTTVCKFKNPKKCRP